MSELSPITNRQVVSNKPGLQAAMASKIFAKSQGLTPVARRAEFSDGSQPLDIPTTPIENQLLQRDLDGLKTLLGDSAEVSQNSATQLMQLYLLLLQAMLADRNRHQQRKRQSQEQGQNLSLENAVTQKDQAQSQCSSAQFRLWAGEGLAIIGFGLSFFVPAGLQIVVQQSLPNLMRNVASTFDTVYGYERQGRIAQVTMANQQHRMKLTDSLEQSNAQYMQELEEDRKRLLEMLKQFNDAKAQTLQSARV